MSSPLVGRARLEITPAYGDIRGPLKREFDKGSSQFTGHGRQAGSNFTSGFGNTVKGTERVAEDSGRRGGIRFVSGFASRIGPRAFSASTGVFASSLQGMTGAAVAGGVALTGLATAGVAAGVTLGVKTAASMEQAQVAFTTLLHSGTQARTFLGNLQKFAAATPFTLPGLVDASRQLLGVGATAQSVIPTLTAWGDTSGALGLTQEQFSRTMIALTQSMANGKIQAGDMLQITQAGIPIWAILARSLGKPVAEVRKLSEGGKLLTADVLPKLQKQMEKDYGGSMAKQSLTLNGIWSTFTDTLSIGLATAVQPLIPALKTGLTGAIGVVGGALRLIPAIGARVGPVFNAMRGDVRAFITAFRAGDGDITSSGFAGALELVGGRARAVFNGITGAAQSVVRFFRGDFVIGLHALVGGLNGVAPGGFGFVHVMSVIGTTLEPLAAKLRALSAFFHGDFIVGIANFKNALAGTAPGGTGFINLMGRIGAQVRVLGPQLMSTGRVIVGALVPSFRMIGDFVTQSLIPSVRNLAVVFLTVILPAIKPTAIIVGTVLLVAFRVFAFLLRDVVGPVLRGVTGFIRQHQTVITALAITVGVLVAGYKAYQLTLIVVNLVQKAFAAGMLLVRGAIVSARVAMFLLNAAFIANPIGVVVIALVALAAGLIYAYKHSETFRNIVSAGWRFVASTASSFWNGFLKPIFHAFGVAIDAVRSNWMGTGKIFGAIWGLIRGFFLGGINFVLTNIGRVLTGFSILTNAASHLPGPLGAPFRKAADAIDSARGKIKQLQDKINQTHGKNVNVGVTIHGQYVVVAGAGTSGAGGKNLRFDTGGFVEGPWKGARADNVWARVNPKEFVVQAPAAMALERRRPGFLQGFVNRFHELDIGGDPSGAWIGRSGKSGIPGRALGGFVGKYAGRFAGGGAIDAVKRWLPSVDPLPYIWGAVGPGGYDCSGLVGEVYNRLLGLSSFTRRFVTANESAFFKPGKGTFTVGINPGQHTAGNIAGLAFEAASTASGIHVGAGAQSVDRFQRVMYLPQIGGTFVAGGSGVAAAPTIGIDILRRIVASMAPGLTAQVAKEMGFHTFDGGGRWPTGTFGYNGSGGDEFVYRDARGGGGLNLSLSVDARGAHDPAAVEAAVDRAGAKLMDELARWLAINPGVG